MRRCSFIVLISLISIAYSSSAALADGFLCVQNDLLGSYQTRSFSQSLRGNILYSTGSTNGLEIYDVSNPREPVRLGFRYTNPSLGVDYVDDVAIVAVGNSGLEFIDVSDPTNPTRINIVETPGAARDIRIQDSIAYIADAEGGLLVLDVTDPVQPNELGSWDSPGNARELLIQGTTLFLSDSEAGMHILDVSDPADPELITTIDQIDFGYSSAYENGTLYVCDGISTLSLFDVRDLHKPRLLGSHTLTDDVRAVEVEDGIAYVAADSEGGLQILDVSEPSNIVRIGWYEVLGVGGANDLTVRDSIAYVSCGTAGIQIFNTHNPTMPILLNHENLGGNVSGFDVHDGIAVTTSLSGLVFTDVSDPTNPVQLGWLKDGFESSFDVELRYGLAFVANRHDGLSIVDYRNPEEPVVLSDFDPSELCLFLSNIFVAGKYAYVINGNGNCDADIGLLIIDIHDFTSPQIVGSFATQTSPSSVFVDGERIYLAAGARGLFILDGTDPTNPILLGSIDTPGSTRGLRVVDDLAFVASSVHGTHILDVSDSTSIDLLSTIPTTQVASDVELFGTTLCIANGVDGIDLVDVSNPVAPRLLGSYDVARFAGQVRVQDQLAYVATADTGLQIYNISNDCAPECNADFFPDGLTDKLDILAFIEAFNTSDTAADFANDGVFDIFDVLSFVEAFNSGCP